MLIGSEEWALVRAYQHGGRVLSADPTHADAHRRLLNGLWQRDLITGGLFPSLTKRGEERARALLARGGK